MAAKDKGVNPKMVAVEPVQRVFPQPPLLTWRSNDNPLPKITEETFGGRFIRRTRENPLVPVGCLGTAGALLYGLRAFHQGNVRRSQAMMRLRVLAQGFTVGAFILGIFINAVKAKK